MMNNGNDFIPGSECPSNSSNFSSMDYSITMRHRKVFEEEYGEYLVETWFSNEVGVINNLHETFVND